MKNTTLRVILLVFFALTSAPRIFAAETNANGTAGTAPPAVRAPEANSAMSDLNDLIGRINEKLQAGKNDESNLTDNIKEFETLLAKHKDAKSEELTQILLMKAQLFNQVLNKPEQALDTYKEIKRNHPDVNITGGIDDVINELQKKVDNLKIQRTLVPGAQFPNFNEIDIAGKPLSPADYKGKVVLIDFWATWCMPCMAELPNVQKTYEKYHAKGFDIIGISLDVDQAKLKNFIKEKKMPWQQYNDGKFWDTKLVSLYGVTAVPATFLLDRSGKIVATNLRGDQLEQAVASETLPWFQKHVVSSRRTIDKAVRSYPYQSLCVIFIAGLLLGALSRRKRAGAAPDKS